MEEKIKEILSKPLEKFNMIVDSVSFSNGNLNIILDNSNYFFL